jgi:cellulose synthase/poly-beta-1,6-N-acetylglucosamine synthase-like glycosyltransferase
LPSTSRLFKLALADIVLTLMAAVLLLPVLFFLLQVLAAIFLAKSSKLSPLNQSKQSNIRPSIAVLMPAHNESLVIAETIRSIMPQLAESDQLLVVADNCNDETAAIAKKLGATVIERSHETDRGKGYALDFGLQYLKNNPPQIVIVIDADCIVALGTIEKLTLACQATQRPVQALYLMQSQPNPSLKARIAQFAWVVKNKVRPLGLKALGMPCQLMGTGMAFLWDDIIQSNLASGHIVEDMILGVDLTRARKAPLFLPEALVTSVFPPTAAATNTQRTRWEHGHLSVIANEVPSLFFEAIKTKNGPMLALACDLLIPPLAVLCLLCAACFLLSLLLSSQPALVLASIMLLALICAVLLAWLGFGREVISFKQLAYAPIYVLIKIPLYIKFFINRQVEWVRSKRD